MNDELAIIMLQHKIALVTKKNIERNVSYVIKLSKF